MLRPMSNTQRYMLHRRWLPRKRRKLQGTRCTRLQACESRLDMGCTQQPVESRRRMQMDSWWHLCQPLRKWHCLARQGNQNKR